MSKIVKNIPDGVLHFVITPAQELFPCSIYGTRTHICLKQLFSLFQRDYGQNARFQSFLQSYFGYSYSQFWYSYSQFWYTVVIHSGGSNWFPLSESTPKCTVSELIFCFCAVFRIHIHFLRIRIRIQWIRIRIRIQSGSRALMTKN